MAQNCHMQSRSNRVVSLGHFLGGRNSRNILSMLKTVRWQQSMRVSHLVVPSSVHTEALYCSSPQFSGSANCLLGAGAGGGRWDGFAHTCAACTNAASHRYAHQPLVKPDSHHTEAQHQAVDQRLDTPDLLHMSRVSSTSCSNLTGHVTLCKCLDSGIQFGDRTRQTCVHS